MGLRRVVLLAVQLLVLGAAGRARAEVGVSIQYQSAEQLDLARRVSSELSSEGYLVALREAPATFPCDTRSAPLATASDTRVWIRFANSTEGDTVVASICYGDRAPWLETSASAPRTEPRRLALATAEALNGLRSQLPPVAESPQRAGAQPKHARQREPLIQVPPAPALTNSALFGLRVALNLPDFPVSPGIAGQVTLGLTSSLGIVIDSFVPVAGSKLTGTEVTAIVRTTWLRLGPRFTTPLGNFQVSGALLGGPALSWATGTAHSPRVGTTDLALGALASLSGSLEYPRRSVLFACGMASASALLPGVRVRLGDDAHVPRGSWLLEGLVGFGARWGGGR